MGFVSKPTETVDSIGNWTNNAKRFAPTNVLDAGADQVAGKAHLPQEPGQLTVVVAAIAAAIASRRRACARADRRNKDKRKGGVSKGGHTHTHTHTHTRTHTNSTPLESKRSPT